MYYEYLSTSDFVQLVTKFKFVSSKHISNYQTYKTYTNLKFLMKNFNIIKGLRPLYIGILFKIAVFNIYSI